jgi:hypothetical protein
MDERLRHSCVLGRSEALLAWSQDLLEDNFV